MQVFSQEIAERGVGQGWVAGHRLDWIQDLSAVIFIFLWLTLTKYHYWFVAKPNVDDGGLWIALSDACVEYLHVHNFV